MCCVSSEPPNPTASGSSLGAGPFCPHCFQWLQPGNHRIRLRPKPHPSPCVQRILQRQPCGKRLSLAQKNLLHRFRNASSAVVRQRHSYFSLLLLFERRLSNQSDSNITACQLVLLQLGPFSLYSSKKQGQINELILATLLISSFK